MEARIPASERTSQKLNELLSHGVADGDARAELLKLAVRKIVEEALEAEVAEAVGAASGRARRAAPRPQAFRETDRRSWTIPRLVSGALDVIARLRIPFRSPAPCFTASPAARPTCAQVRVRLGYVRCRDLPRSAHC